MIPPDHPQAGPEPNTFWALKDVSFTVEQGDIVGIIGRNGAGKSTLLKVLTRITEPTSGRAVLRGRVGSLLEVGTGFHPELTGRENIFLNGAILGMRRREIERKFDEIVAFSEVERFIDTPVKRYSSGMYVRLAFAVAAHLDPEILLVDEVLAVGDAAFQKKCLGKMGEVASQGRTVLFVSHYMHVVRSFCSRLVYLEAGRADASLSIGDAISRYAGVAAEENEVVTDVSELPREHEGLGTATRIVEARVLRRGHLREDQSAEVRLAVRSDTPRDGIIVGVYIHAPGVGTVGVAQAPLAGTLSAGRNDIRLMLRPWQLAPGNYLIGFFVRDKVRDFDYVREFCPLTLRASSADCGGCEHWHETWGFLRLDMEVKLDGQDGITARGSAVRGKTVEAGEQL